ncbi:hypothetical protein NV115_004221 [Vibrio alginolyticus]|nr:hypothetical protein [Vibrio alginolyticus]EJT1897109.1 hypothetical protein [Vibrio alginolyticus]ELK2079178.1 hypothetical protein [Vibrio alginolyticus]
MQEWLMKLFSSIMSLKTAFIAVVTIILAITNWQAAEAFVISKGVPSAFAQFFILMGAYGAAHIIVELGIYAKTRWVNWRQETREASEQKAKRKADIANREAELDLFKATARKAIPYLPSRHIEILMELHEEEHVPYNQFKEGIPNLLKLNYIQAVSLINKEHYLFKINPEVFEVVDSYLKKQREELLDKFCEELSDNDMEFLRIFFDKEIPFGVPNTEMMPAAVYRGGEAMEWKGIINCTRKGQKQKNNPHVVFQLPKDVEEKLKTNKGVNSSHRNNAEIHLAHVLAECATISKAPPPISPVT